MARDVVPEGLQLHKKANLDSFSDAFENNWLNILNGASRQMRDLVRTETHLAIEHITKRILDLEECIVKDYGDVGVYVTLDKDPTNDMIKKVNNRVQRAHEEGCISDSTLDYLLVNSTAKAGRFYLLPKLHK